MIRGTTPTLRFKINSDLGKLACGFVTFVQSNKNILEKTLDHCEIVDNTLSVTLTQEETLLFDSQKYVDMQIRVKTDTGKALASNVVRCNCGDILKEGVI